MKLSLVEQLHLKSGKSPPTLISYGVE